MVINVVRAIHLTGYLRTLGGMQSILRHHLAHDHAAGIDAHQIVFFERHDPDAGQVDALGWNWRWTISRMRPAFRSVLDHWPGRLVLYHNLWGLPFLADLDRAGRRVGFLHAYPPDLAASLRAAQGLIDGLITVSQAPFELAAQCLPELVPHRLHLVPLPIQPPVREWIHPPLNHRALVVGYSGRVVKEDKRVDRLPQLARLLTQQGVDYRLEILGDGGDAAWLKRQFPADASIVHHGMKTGAAYWEILAGWDVLVFVSDTEGTPISLLEGLSCGVIPIFPDIASNGAAYSRQVHASLVYPPGDLAAAARAIGSLARMPTQEYDAWRVKCLDAVKPHLGRTYIDTFKRILEEINHLPRASREAATHRGGFATDYVPLGLLSRLARHGLLTR